MDPRPAQDNGLPARANDSPPTPDHRRRWYHRPAKWYTAARARRLDRHDLIAQLTALMSDALHEPPVRARRLARAHIARAKAVSHRTLQVLARLRHGAEPGLATTTGERKRIANFVEFLRDDPAPKIVCAIHTGAFLLDAIKVLPHLPSGMSVRVPVPGRSTAAIAPVVRYAGHHGVRLECIPIKQGGTLIDTAVAPAARLIFAMTDLDATYGRTMASEFLGAPAHFVVGPYVLARRLRATVAYFDCSHSNLTFDSSIDDQPGAAPCATAALARRFATRMNGSVWTDPVAWRRWHSLPLLRIDPARRDRPC